MTERHEPTGTEHVRFYFTGHVPGVSSALMPTWQADFPETGHKVTVLGLGPDGGIKRFRVTLWGPDGKEIVSDDTDEGYQFWLGRRLLRDAIQGD